MSIELDVIKRLTLFLLEKSEDIFVSPIDGNLVYIANWFYQDRDIKFVDSKNTLEDFQSLLSCLNEISAESIKVESCQFASLGHTSKISWINIPNLLILRDRLQDFKAKNISYKPKPFKSLQNGNFPRSIHTYLEGPLFTDLELGFSNGTVLDTSFNVNFQNLESILKKPTARYFLSKEKAKAKTARKAFLEICDNKYHSNILSNLSFNRKDNLGNISANLLKNNNLYEKLSSMQHLMKPDIFKCSQSKTHFLPVLNSHTDLQLGDCSYLDTCHKMKTCRYLHYYTLTPPSLKEEKFDPVKSYHNEYTIGECFSEYSRTLAPPQWINCDVRYLPFPILGKFAAIISDPAWDIHMFLPYGTCKDFELLSLPMQELQDEGIIMLWVTGRSIEVGRRALKKWGYTCSDEMIWVKLNQLKRIIVTGRTGHWLNHSKEHLLVGIKGSPEWLNRRLDMDVMVSGTRETSRKPDEVYDIVERLVGKHSRKLEIFGRDHNVRPGWLTIGNQLSGTCIQEKDIKLKYDNYLKSKKKGETHLTQNI